MQFTNSMNYNKIETWLTLLSTMRSLKENFLAKTWYIIPNICIF
jgi:hypothetical protein